MSGTNFNDTTALPALGVPTTITVANEASDTSCFLLFTTAATGDLAPKSNGNLSFNSSTGTLDVFAASISNLTLVNALNAPAVNIGYSGLTVEDISETRKLYLSWEESAGADKLIGFKVNAGNRTIDLSGNITVPSNATVSGTNTGDNDIRTATATLDFGSIASNGSAELTITVTGAAANDTVMLGAPAALEAGLTFSGFVSATNTVTVRVHNVSGGSVDPASATWRATVLKL